ncbi:MAG: acyl-CoA dehydrogenase family protein [Sulfuricaulis sp.]|nr:acyl-CoA dehydrogenase family protein [Sulfuricaulis sp.]
MHQASWMNPELETVRDNARRFYETELLPHEERWSRQQCVDREVWYKAAAAGLLCPGISEEYGGGGGNFLHEAVIFAEQGRMMCPGLGNALHSGIVAHYLDNFATEEQKREWLPKMASGELVGGLAMTEPGTGSDLQSIRTSAVRDGDHYVINGAKTYITNGTTANLICLVLKTDPTKGGKGISIVVVETDKVKGLRRGSPLSKVGLHSQDTAELYFDDMHVPCANLLGPEEGQGFRQLMKELARERLITSLMSLACMERAIEETLAFTGARKVFGQSLLSMQNTRFKLAECETKATLAGAFLDQCANKLLIGQLDGTTAAMAKWWVTEACGQVVDECVQLHGGAGYMLEYPIARLYQNVRIHRILAGTNEIMKELIARDMEKRLT